MTNYHYYLLGLKYKLCYYFPNLFLKSIFIINILFCIKYLIMKYKYNLNRMKESTIYNINMVQIKSSL